MSNISSNAKQRFRIRLQNIEDADEILSNIESTDSKIEEALEDYDTSVVVDNKISDAVDPHISNLNNPHDVTKTQLGLGNVDNTSDINKPISNAAQTALNSKEPIIVAGTVNEYYRGDKTFQTLDASTIGLENVDNTSDLDKPISTATQDALDLKQDSLIGDDNQLFYQTAPNIISPIPSFFIDPTTLGVRLTNTIDSSISNTGNTVHNKQIEIRATEDNNANFTIDNKYVYTNNDYNLGVGGRYVTMSNHSVYHERNTDIGEINFITNSIIVGDGTNACNVGGFSYNYGFGNIRNQANVVGPIQGYSFQPNFESGSTVDTNTAYVQSFYDSLNGYNTTFGFYTSFNASPNLFAIADNRNYTGMNISANIQQFIGNANYTGIGIYGTLGSFDTGNFNGINISPNVTTVQNATGLNINMNNVNATNSKYAIQVSGDVQINGNLQFSGAFSAGLLQAFYQTALVDQAGDPSIGHNIFAGAQSPLNTTTANCDFIANIINGYIAMEDNSVATSGAFELGLSSFAAVCNISSNVGSTLDHATACVAPISLDELSTGGTIDYVKNFRAVAIPNGITTINNHRGFQFDIPFGSIATNTHAFYTDADVNNYFRGNLLVGELADTVANSSVGLEINSTTKAFLNARMIESERDSLTALDGMQIYNLTTNKLQVYASGSWIDLH